MMRPTGGSIKVLLLCAFFLAMGVGVARLARSPREPLLPRLNLSCSASLVVPIAMGLSLLIVLLFVVRWLNE